MSATPHRCWYRLIHDIYLFLDANENRIFEKYNLTTTAYRVLLLLDRDDAKNLVTLSDELWCARSTVTRLIGKMEKHGWVERVTDPKNRRAHLVTLSPAGVELRDKAQVAHARMLTNALDSVPVSERDSMIQSLKQVRDRLLADLEEADAESADGLNT